jgi:hypothetical protein
MASTGFAFWRRWSGLVPGCCCLGFRGFYVGSIFYHY